MLMIRKHRKRRTTVMMKNDCTINENLKELVEEVEKTGLPVAMSMVCICDGHLTAAICHSIRGHLSFVSILPSPTGLSDSIYVIIIPLHSTKLINFKLLNSLLSSWYGHFHLPPSCRFSLDSDGSLSPR